MQWEASQEREPSYEPSVRTDLLGTNLRQTGAPTRGRMAQAGCFGGASQACGTSSVTGTSSTRQALPPLS